MPRVRGVKRTPRPPEDGAVVLVAAFWKQVHEDLRWGHYPTRRWITGRAPGFLSWCAICDVDPNDVEEAMRQAHPRIFGLTQ